MRLLLCLLLCISPDAFAQPLPPLIPYKTVRGWGFSDSNKVLKIPAIYSWVDEFRNGKALVTIGQEDRHRGPKHDLEYCLIDQSGRYLIPPEWRWNGLTRYWHNGLNVRDSNNRWGMVDDTGAIVLPFLYDSSGNVFSRLKGFDPLFLIAAKYGRTGVIDRENKTLIPFEFDQIKPSVSTYYETLNGWLVQKDGLWGVLHKDGSLHFPARYDAIYPAYYRGWAAARIGNKMGAVDSTGKIIVPFRYDSVGRPVYDGFPVRSGEHWGWYNAVTGDAVKPQFGCCPYGKGAYVRVDTVSRTDNSYYSKPMLLDRKGRRLISHLQDYSDIYLYGDSVVVSKYLHTGGPQDYRASFSRMNEKTWKPGPWSETYPFDNIYRAMVRAKEPVPVYSSGPFIYRGGRRIDTFRKDGFTWHVTGYVARDDSFRYIGGHPLNKYYAVAGIGPGGDSLFALVDSAEQFIIKPQKKFMILSGNALHNYLIVRRGSRYAVINFSLRYKVRPLKLPVTEYFRWQGRSYVFGQWAPNQRAGDELRWDASYCYPCNCQTVMNRRGKVLAGFDSTCGPGFYMLRYAPVVRPNTDIISLADRNKKAGFISLNGKVRFPAISFKHSYLRFLGPNVVATPAGIIDTLNSPYFPERYSRESVSDTYGSRLYHIPDEKMTYRQTHVYFDYRGTVYADPEALQ